LEVVAFALLRRHEIQGDCQEFAQFGHEWTARIPGVETRAPAHPADKKAGALEPVELCLDRPERGVVCACDLGRVAVPVVLEEEHHARRVPSAEQPFEHDPIIPLRKGVI